MLKLQRTAPDRFASATRLVGAIGSAYAPILAPVAAELLANIIPNQQIDRVADQVRRLELEVKTLAHEISVVEENVRSSEGQALIEEGLVQTAAETDLEIRKKICSLLAYSLTEDDLEFYRAKKLLRLLKELIYPEIIWLIHYSTKTQKPLSYDSREVSIPSESDFQNQHWAILEEKGYTLIGPQKNMDDEALQRSYKATLLRLGLIEEEKDGRRDYELTMLGYLLVRNILSPIPDAQAP